MRQLVFIPVLALALSGCALFQEEAPATRPASVTGPPDPQAATEFAPAVAATTLGARASSAEALDSTTAEEKAAALAAPATGGERELGKVVVALGPPAEQGIWLSSELVKEKTQGRIMTAAGKSLSLELRPGTGGALLSLAAFQALGLSLTELPEVTVYGP
ncbi:D-galactarate dehydratase [Tabrizicola sp.]|uniref:D-galactarate dehydratase n=1 Tax=Tabrizicola sp. TaxID=2005166 RepID=UPI003F3F39A0